jgi:hypothetical protein
LDNSQTPNELRIDAAERDKVKRRRVSAAASIRVERSRTPEHTALLEIKAEGQPEKSCQINPPPIHRGIVQGKGSFLQRKEVMIRL